MSNIITSQEDIKRLQDQYLNDSIIKGLLEQKHHIVHNAMPKYLLKNGELTAIYEGPDKSQLDNIEMQLTDYITRTYPEIISNTSQ